MTPQRAKSEGRQSGKENVAVQLNTRVVLASFPKDLPSVENFRIEEVPVDEIANGEVLLGTRFVSVDAHMRAHVPSLEGDNTLQARSLIEADGTAEVLQSNHPSFRPGQLVIARTGWQSNPRLRGEEGAGSLATSDRSSWARDDCHPCSEQQFALSCYNDRVHL